MKNPGQKNPPGSCNLFRPSCHSLNRTNWKHGSGAFPSPRRKSTETAVRPPFHHSLPDGYREIIVLHDIEGYTHEEIAGFLGIDRGTSRSQLSRARKAVRAMLTASYRETI